MQFDKGIWESAWDVFQVNLKTVGLAIAMAIVLDLVIEYLEETGSYRTIADLIIWGMVAISMHGTVLLDKANLATTDSKLLMPFVWRSFILMLLTLVPFLIVLFWIHDSGNIYWSVFKALPALGLAGLVVFALLGTWLPAVVANGDRRIGTALARGERTFLYAAPRLLLGPGLLQAAMLAAIMVLGMRGLLAGEIFGAAGFSLPDLISLPVIYAVRAFTVTLLAVILSRAYLIGERKTDSSIAQTPGA